MRCNMEKMMLKIKTDQQKKGITNKAIAPRLKVSEGMITNYFSLTNKIGGHKFAELITIIYENEESKIDNYLIEYAKSKNKDEHIIELLEWCHHNGKNTVQREILKHHKKNENPIYLYYSLFFKRSEGTILPEKFIIELENIKYQSNKTPEFKALGWIGLLYAYYDLDNFNMFFLAEEALKDVLSIKNVKNNFNFLKESLKVRIYEIYATGYFKQNKIDAAKDATLKLIKLETINLYPRSLSFGLMLLSQLYTFDDYKKSLLYIKKAICLFNQISLDKNTRRKLKLEATHDFIKITNNDFTDLYLTDSAEESHLLAKIGGKENTIRSLALLEEIKSKNGKLSNFQMYYKALALRNTEYMAEVKENFIKSGDLYYSRLPKTELETYKTDKLC